MEIRTYDPGDWPALRAFVNQHWRAGHPYTDRILFEWQFMGFATDRPISRVLVHDGEIAGFLGAIPGLYWANGKVLPGAVYDLWVVRPDLRNAGLGILLMKSLEDEFEVCSCLGVNHDVVKFYTARGYAYAPALRRWIVPLRKEGFRRITQDASIGTDDVPAVPDLHDAMDVQPIRSPDALTLQIVYERTVEENFRFALHRNADFWTWRYVRSAGYRYNFFGSVVELGIVVARIETVIAPDQPDLNGMKVLRIIELMPTRPEAWQGQPDDAHLALLRGVLAWAFRKQCVLADFQLSSGRLGHLLQQAGLVEVSPAAPAAINAVPTLFQPLRRDMQPINYVWRLTGSASHKKPVEPDDLYFAKSDDGMDRPNVWPLPAGHA